MAHRPLSPSHLADDLAALARAPRWWLAYSGGLDSSVLLHLLCQVRALQPGLPPLTALHINHRLHADAAQWQAHCAARCAELGVPLVAATVDVASDGDGLEAAARRARHRVFKQHLQAGEVLFTAHHQDDQVETLLLRLLRGAGVEGMGAIAPARPLGQGTVHRPLLGVPRSALLAYARQHGLGWVDDPSNTDTNLDRNYLRQRVLPLLAERWPGYRATLSRAAGAQRDVAALLEESLGPLPRVHNTFGDPGLALAPLLAHSDAAAAALLRRWFGELGLRAPDRVALLELLRQLRASDAGAPRLVVDGAEIQRFGAGLYRLPGSDGPAAQAAGQSLGPGQTLDIGALGRLALVPAPAGAPGLYLGPTQLLTLGFRRGGERCRPAGRGGSCPLKQWLQEQGVPPWWRARLPLLYLDGELRVIGDRWYCDSAAPQPARDGGAGRWQVRWERNCPTAAD
ncbi:tRNA lysidine(34) synthetase TilS [Parahaliea mediterranea]|uniref:tRNA lysidine(34) synthetase TilS n=1 Tax=Parahaliea mediterranea TaxID=651086 RepID=UPI000E2F36C4|nr:tRNA lysidine(34) synthetase TilS [Parahaliea mediterranea]